MPENGRLAETKPNELFGEYYYAHDCGRPYRRDEQWLQFFGTIADRIIADIHPHSVLDAGCAMGFLVEALRDRGVEAYGIDMSEYALENVRPDIRAFCARHSVCDPLPHKYDLIVCIEVLEHMEAIQAEKAIQNLCSYTDDILFSSSPIDYSEATHFNVRPPEYWAGLYAEQGFARDVDFDASCITHWAARFRRRADPWPHLVKDYERKFWQLWKETTDLRARNLELHRLREADEAAVERQKSEVDAIKQSDTWQLLQSISRMRVRVAPVNSRREKLLLRLKSMILKSRKTDG